MVLEIKGFVKTTLVDYPGKVACTIFLPGCNFGCGFCHNKDLVLGGNLPTISEQEVLEYLSEKKKWIDGVVVSGGEPLLHKGLLDFLVKVKDMGFKVKIDTNGTRSDFLKELVDKKIVDFVAMDIKNSFEKYSETARAPVDLEMVKKSIDLVRNSGVGYEFRTTLVPGLHSEEEVGKIGEMLEGSKRFAIQNFRADENVIEESFRGVKSFSKGELERFKNILESFIDKVEVRE